jgi:hypothetical protein
MDGYIGSWTFVAQYCGYVFVSFVGVLQLVAARWGFHGISFFRNRIWGYVFGTIAIVAAFVWFFAFTGLDLSEPTFDTPPQLLWLAVSVACAILFTLAVSSLVNKKMNPPVQGDSAGETGLDTLKQKTYWSAIRHYLKKVKTQ